VHAAQLLGVVAQDAVGGDQQATLVKRLVEVALGAVVDGAAQRRGVIAQLVAPVAD